ncbi:hypothetical protein [Inconstantimicrobium mannanitabidum]|uniref:Uncharacterized protein n=1 Tax=Inconstantimicrobium mannanitabidum TaxID=1604901 RepID=A0ACB5R9Y9_9CLOT|nr:hypothetical protein [Clostridium sp. TW13]GKX66003.1 hypothetical protein rsdtw13_12610 [Clostridium sp. TW13]
MDDESKNIDDENNIDESSFERVNQNYIKAKAIIDQQQGEDNSGSSSSSSNIDNNTNATVNEDVNEQKLLAYGKIVDIINNTSNVKDSLQNLAVDEIELLYYERKVKPLVEMMNNLSIASFNMAATANLFQGNALQDKKDVKAALDLSVYIEEQLKFTARLLDGRLDCFKSRMNGCEK